MSKQKVDFSAQQMLLPLLPQQLKTFELFFTGKNDLAVQSLRQTPPAQFIYLFGQSSSGKSHLLEAFAMQGLSAHKRILFLPLKQLINQKDYLKDWPKFDAVLLDDLEFLPPELETELFHRFNELQAEGSTLIVTSTLAPSNLNIELPDLKSRLNSGLALKLEPLRDIELRQALQKHAAALSLSLDDKLYDYLLNHLNRDLETLIKQIKKIADYSLIKKRSVTLALIKEALSN